MAASLTIEFQVESEHQMAAPVYSGVERSNQFSFQPPAVPDLTKPLTTPAPGGIADSHSYGPVSYNQMFHDFLIIGCQAL